MTLEQYFWPILQMLKSAKSDVLAMFWRILRNRPGLKVINLPFWTSQQDFTSVQQPLTDSLRHVERQPLSLRAGAHHLAANVALCGGREVLVT